MKLGLLQSSGAFALIILSFALIEESRAICVRFEEFDQTFVEGRDSDLLFLRKPQTDDPVAVTVNLFTVDEFDAFINSSNRTLDDVTITRIEGIEFPATAGADFNSTPFSFEFAADDVETSLPLTEITIFDDDVAEPIEGFVVVLESNCTINAFPNQDGDILRFNIIDNDEVTIGLERNVYSINEDGGNLTDVFVILTGAISERNITVNVTIIDNGVSATRDVDFSPENGIYSYLVTVYAGQRSAPINPIEIFDDDIFEGDEMFFIVLSDPIPSDVGITPGGAMAAVVIIDNDVTTTVVTPTPTITPPVTPPMDMGGDPHYSIMLPTGQLLCFSVHGEKDFPFNLISNNLLQMNAFFIEDAKREEITWIGSLGVVVQHSSYKKSNTTKIRFEAKEQMIYINNGVSLHAKRVERLTLSNGRLSVTEAVRKDAEKRAEVEVDLVDVGLAFSVRFVKKRHLDMSWRKVSKQPTDSHGIIGQFLREGVRINEVTKLLYLPNLRPVPVMRSSIWHFMERDNPDPGQQYCWQAMNPGYQGKRLIEGTYLNYLVDDVLSSDFKFSI